MGGVEQYSFYIIAWDDWPPRSRVYWEKNTCTDGPNDVGCDMRELVRQIAELVPPSRDLP